MIIWRILCKDCDKEFLADTQRHHMDCCPTKGCRNAVDLEEHYCRYTGNVEVESRFEPPMFDDEDDYHSALMTWLNNSKDEYYLEKKEGILLIIKDEVKHNG